MFAGPPQLRPTTSLSTWLVFLCGFYTVCETSCVSIVLQIKRQSSCTNCNQNIYDVRLLKLMLQHASYPFTNLVLLIMFSTRVYDITHFWRAELIWWHSRSLHALGHYKASMKWLFTKIILDPRLFSWHSQDIFNYFRTTINTCCYPQGLRCFSKFSVHLTHWELFSIRERNMLQLKKLHSSFLSSSWYRCSPPFSHMRIVWTFKILICWSALSFLVYIMEDGLVPKRVMLVIGAVCVA